MEILTLVNGVRQEVTYDEPVGLRVAVEQAHLDDAGGDPSQLELVRWNEDDNEWQLVPSVYDASPAPAGSIVAQLSSFSVYAVSVPQAAPSPTPTPTPNPSPTPTQPAPSPTPAPEVTVIPEEQFERVPALGGGVCVVHPDASRSCEWPDQGWVLSFPAYVYEESFQARVREVPVGDLPQLPERGALSAVRVELFDWQGNPLAGSLWRSMSLTVTARPEHEEPLGGRSLFTSAALNGEVWLQSTAGGSWTVGSVRLEGGQARFTSQRDGAFDAVLVTSVALPGEEPGPTPTPGPMTTATPTPTPGVTPGPTATAQPTPSAPGAPEGPSGALMIVVLAFIAAGSMAGGWYWLATRRRGSGDE